MSATLRQTDFRYVRKRSRICTSWRKYSIRGTAIPTWVHSSSVHMNLPDPSRTQNAPIENPCLVEANYCSLRIPLDVHSNASFSNRVHKLYSISFSTQQFLGNEQKSSTSSSCPSPLQLIESPLAPLSQQRLEVHRELETPHDLVALHDNRARPQDQAPKLRRRYIAALTKDVVRNSHACQISKRTGALTRGKSRIPASFATRLSAGVPASRLISQNVQHLQLLVPLGITLRSSPRWNCPPWNRIRAPAPANDLHICCKYVLRIRRKNKSRRWFPVCEFFIVQIGSSHRDWRSNDTWFRITVP